MRKTYGIVRRLQVPEDVPFASAPDAAIAVLVGGEILELRLQALAVRVSRVFLGHVRGAGQPEDVFHVDVPVEHEPVEVGMGNVVPEVAELGTTRPDALADFRVQELTDRVLRQREPEAILVGARGHIADE